MMDGMDGMGGGMGMGAMMLMMVLWALVGLAVLALAVVGIVWLVRRTAPADAHRPESPEEILKRRYAAGEIDEDEFQRRRTGLQ
jgi:putative membrane protein